MAFETAFIMDTSSIKFGPGVTREVGYDMHMQGSKRVMVVVDPILAKGEGVAIALKALRTEGIEAVLYDQVTIEPTDASFMDAIRFATQGKFDGFVAIGGGSTIDTAKAANLYSTYPADFMDYVNAPIGRGKPVPGKLKPLIAVPTTAGTGSETTGIAIFDYLEMHYKTGIAHRFLRPVLGIIDPDHTRSLPKMVAACTGFDILTHALESFLALPYHQRLAPEHPSLRPAYQGANPISDIWSMRALEIVAQYLLRAVADAADEEARGQMLLAAAFAGIGFGNAGVTVAHGMSYPIAGMVRSYYAEGYPKDHPLIPHGMSVVLTAPAIFRFTAPADPKRHLHAVQLLGVDISQAKPEEAGDLLSEAIADLMIRAGMPNGLSAVGYNEGDIDQLVAGTLPQHRVTKLSPIPVDEKVLRKLFLESMKIW